MTIQNIIDTYNYSVVTGCQLSKKATNELYDALLEHIDMNGDAYLDDNKSSMVPYFLKVQDHISKDFMTFTGYRPKTKILYSNYCELELLRILYLLQPISSDYNWIFETVRDRIRETCFGRFCPTGECFEISILALRFISTVFPEEKLWIDLYVTNIAHTIFSQKRRISKRTELLFCQVLTELRREKDGMLLDEILGFVDVDHMHHVSKVSHEINACILYSSMRRTVLAS
jgi:hypothetical protein